MLPQNFDGGQTFNDAVQTSDDITDSQVADVATTTVLRNGLWFGYVVKSLSIFLANGRSDHQTHHVHDRDVEAPLLEQEIATNGHVIIDTTQISTDKDKLVRIVKEKDLNGLRRLGGVDRAVSLQRSHFEGNDDDGIGDEDPQEYWERIQGKGFTFFLKQAVNTYTIFLLFVAAVLLFSTEIIEEGPKEGWHDGVAVVFGIFLLVSFPSLGNFLRERKAIKMMLKEQNEMKLVEVERNGNPRRVAFYQVRAWDTVHLEPGDRIPADGLLTSVERLRSDEVRGSEIDRDRNPFLVSGSKVEEGRGSMIIVVSDFGSNANPTADDNLHEPREGVLFCARMQKPYEYIEKLALFMSVIIALIALIRVLCKTRDGYYNGVPEMKGRLTMKTAVEMFERIILKPRGRVSTLVSALVTLVVGVQHGMPLVVRVCLRYWRAKLSCGRVTLNSLSASCTLGLVTAVVVDGGNGDLLHKKPEVKEFFMGERDVTAEEFEPLPSERLEVLNSILRRGICWDYVPEISTSLARKVTVSWEKNSKWGAANMEEESRVVEYRRSSSSGKKGCEVLMRKIGEDEQSLHLHWKGPPLEILDMCSHFYDSRGEILSLTDDLKRVTFEKLIKDMKTKGLIPIAFAHRQTNVGELEKEGLILLAIVGLKYECQRDVKALVNYFREAGVVNIVLASGGDPEVAKSISQELGFSSSSNDTVIEVDQGIEDLVESSTTTMEEFQMIENLQENGHVVAFVGGSSIRDISALNKADLVITQETRCIEIAKRRSDILLNNSLPHSLAPIRHFGKCVYHNIQKFFKLQLTFWISGLSVILISTMHSGESPISSVQMIWVSLILSLLCGLMMVIELNNYDNQSSKRSELLVTQATWTSIAIQVLCQVCLLLIMHFLIGTKYASTKTKRDILNTMIFNTFTLCQIFNLLNSMNLAKKEVLGIVLSNICFVVVLVGVLCFQVIVVRFGKGFLICENLNVKQCALCFLLAAFLLIVDSVIHSLVSWFSLEVVLSFEFFRALGKFKIFRFLRS